MSSTTEFGKILPVSKKTRIVTLLKDAIESGKLQSGDPIVENKLAQELGVGQGLVREALIELEHNGFVQRTPFSGTQVTRLTHEDARQIFDIRVELEPLAIVLAGWNASDAEIRKLRKLADETRKSVDDEGLDQFFHDHLAYRQMTWNLSGNAYLEQTLERLVVPLFGLYLIRGSYNREGLRETAIEGVEHQEQVVRALESRDLDTARRSTREFLERMKATIGDRLLSGSD